MILQRNILILYNINYHQQFIECYKELSEAICILSSETFAVILYMLLLIRLQSRAFINWGKVVARSWSIASRQVLTFMALWILCERDGFRGNFQETVGDEQQNIN